MNQYTKRKLNEALKFTQNDVNKMPTDKLYDYVKIMTKEANRRRDILINHPIMENNPCGYPPGNHGCHEADFLSDFSVWKWQDDLLT